MKLTQTILLSSTMLLMATGNKLGLRSLAEENEEPGQPKTVNVNMSMLIDNLTFKQPLNGLCLAISSFKLSDIDLNSDDDDNKSDEDNGMYPIFPDLPIELEPIMWTPGKQASDGLKALAEEGYCDDLYDEIKQKRPEIIIPTDVVVTPIVTPMEDQNEMISERAMVNFTIPVELSKLNRPPILLLSMVSRLANTNDGFAGFQRLPIFLSRDENIVTTNDMIVPAYDAGTELNTQLCVDMPMSTVSEAVECEGVNSANGNPQPGEGKVHIHRGIHRQDGKGFINQPTDTPTDNDSSSTTTTMTSPTSSTETSSAPTTRNLVETTATTDNRSSSTTTTMTSPTSSTDTSSSPTTRNKAATTATTDNRSSSTTATTMTSPTSSTETSSAPTTRNLVDDISSEQRLGSFDYAFHNPVAKVVVASFWTEESSN